MQISSLLIEALANVFGFMEARGIASFGRGNAWTSPIVWNRVDITEHFPDVGSYNYHPSNVLCLFFPSALVLPFLTCYP